MAFKTNYEDPELEVARLAAAPEGSRDHVLSTLPVNIAGVLEHRLIELPPASMGGHTVVVLPTERWLPPSERGQLPWKRHRGSWRCIVVASDHPSYPAGPGGYRLDIPAAQLVRGRIRELAPA